MKTLNFKEKILSILLILSLISIGCKKPSIKDYFNNEKTLIDTVVVNKPVMPVINQSNIVFDSDFSNFNHVDYGFTMPAGLQLTNAPNSTIPSPNYINTENINNQFKFTIKKECPYTQNFQQFIIITNDKIYKNGKKYKTSFDVIETSKIDGIVDIQFGIFNGKTGTSGNIKVISDGRNLKLDIKGHYEFTDVVDWGSDINLYLYFKLINFNPRTTDGYIIIDNLRIEEIL